MYKVQEQGCSFLDLTCTLQNLSCFPAFLDWSNYKIAYRTIGNLSFFFLIISLFLAIPSRINNTISRDWKEGHIFKERKELQLFVSYCAASPVCFKIGRITFTSTLAWFSFFFGSTGLLFHFFWCGNAVVSVTLLFRPYHQHHTPFISCYIILLLLSEYNFKGWNCPIQIY